MTKIELVNRDGETLVLNVAGEQPIQSGWLGALCSKVFGSGAAGLITLLPPMAAVPLRTECTDRPLIGGEINIP